MVKKVLLLAVVSIGLFTLNALSKEIDFLEKDALSFSGTKAAFSALKDAEKGFRFDTTNADTTKFRWGRALAKAKPLNGDFRLDVSWEIKRLDPYTSFGIELRGKDPKAFMITLKRARVKAEINRILCEITLDGKTTKKEFPYTGYQGAFIIEHSGAAYTFYIVDSSGNPHKLHEEKDLPALPVTPAVKFDCAAAVVLNVAISELTATVADEDQADAE